MTGLLDLVRLVWEAIRVAIGGAAYMQGRAAGAADAGAARDLEEARRRAEAAEAALEVQDGTLADMARRPRPDDPRAGGLADRLRDGSFGALAPADRGRPPAG